MKVVDAKAIAKRVCERLFAPEDTVVMEIIAEEIEKAAKPVEAKVPTRGEYVAAAVFNPSTVNPSALKMNLAYARSKASYWAIRDLAGNCSEIREELAALIDSERASAAKEEREAVSEWLWVNGSDLYKNINSLEHLRRNAGIIQPKKGA